MQKTTNKQRDEQIKLFRNRGWTYQRIADRYNITQERVRQVIGYRIEKVIDSDKVLQELKKRYKERFSNQLREKELLEDIKKAAIQSRKVEDVLRRKELICYLYNQLEMSFTEIGTILKRDHSSIMHLYYKKYDKNSK